MNVAPRIDETWIAAEVLAAQPHARIPALQEIVAYLASPDTGEPLRLAAGSRTLTDGTHTFSCLGDLPMLLPSRLARYFDGHLKVPPLASADPLLSYFALASVRHGGEINAPSTNIHFQRHLHRMHTFVRDCRGVILDVGCDDATIGASLFPAGSRYIGLDPFSAHPSPFRLIGVAEFLPIRSGSLDVVVFNTTLDHIFDWHRAIDEAHRVLRAGGQLVIASLVWTADADLLRDVVHFHHFRDYEIIGALSQFAVDDVTRYDYKGDRHRHGMYLRAVKR